MPRLHSVHMELAIVELLGYRVHTIVPNVSFGLGLSHECDLLVLGNKSGRFTEIEIKISKSDFDADLKKKHNHYHKLITRLVFAVPEFLVDHARDVLPEKVGLIEVKWNTYRNRFDATWVRQCKHAKGSPVPPIKDVMKFMSLGCMRIWTLKKKLNSRKNGNSN